MKKAWKKEYVRQVQAQRAAIGETRLNRAQISLLIVNEAKSRELKARQGEVK